MEYGILITGDGDATAQDPYKAWAEIAQTHEEALRNALLDSEFVREFKGAEEVTFLVYQVRQPRFEPRIFSAKPVMTFEITEELILLTRLK